MQLNVVILNWNARRDTIDCLRRIAGWKRIEARVCVVDNGSMPDESPAIAEACPQVRLVRSDENLGFAGGTNLGIRTLLRESGAPFLLLNNDVVADEGAIEQLAQTLEAEPECALVGPLIYTADEPPTLLSAGSRSPVLHRDHSIKQPPEGPGVYDAEFVSGAAVVIRATVLQEIGLLNEAYFFGLELADFCRRAQAVGHRCLVNRAARVAHDIDRASVYRETLYVYYVVRNRLLYARRFFRFSWPLLLLGWSLYGLQQAGRLWLKQRRGTATAIALGVRDGVRGRFGNQNEAVLRLCGVPPKAA
ncbi:MAG: glycosyltransferase family 2 protein [Acidobacteriota bacterium]